jgi:hypothetical protein
LSETLQLDQVRIIQLDDAPRLLVEWSSRWDEFVTSIGPAFARSGPRLAGEAPHGIFPYRGLIASILLESFLLFVVAVLPRQLYRLRPYAAPRIRPDEVIYYSGDELPRTEDLGGAQSGKNARAGGEEAHHRTQTIRVARGSSLAQQIVDAPNLKLPSSTAAVANLLAFKSDPGPPPAEGLRSSLSPLTLPADVVAPAPTNVTREHSRAGIQLDSVVPPAPNVSADRARSAPALNSAIVPPVPSVRSDHTLTAPTLTTSVIAPAPNVSRDRTLKAPALDAQIIAPATTRVSRDLPRSAPALNGSVIPPAPTAAGREVAPSRVQMNATVVPPPVSAPAREAARTAKLNLPAPSVIAPPPSADSSRDMRRLESGSVGANSPAVVPPPPSQAGNTSFVSSVIGKLFGTQDVVPPSPSTAASGTSRNGGTALAANVIPPPPAASGGTAVTSRRTSLSASIVPPPPSANVSEEGPGTGSSRRTSINSAVIPPPPAVGGTSSNGAVGTRTSRAASVGNGLAGNIVPPPPSISPGSGLSGSGRTGSGLGGPGDAGSALAPPKSASGTPDNSGVVLSTQPGSSVAKPGSGGKGALAMSPAGADEPGVGGSGGGTGIGHGSGTGSGLASEKPTESTTGKIAENTGAGKTGSGRGSDLNARGGISPTPGSGGAGTVPTGSPVVPGVDVRGGSTTTVVTLPSFADSGSAPSVPVRSSIRQQQGPAITIVATSRSGGAFDFYGKLPGDNYTVYVDTPIGTAVMQFAEVNPASHTQAGALIGPQGIRTTLPADLPHARVVVKCTLDAFGNLRNLQVLEPGPAAMTAKIVAALPSWKFRPAMRGVQPVEVNAILGFNIDTNDRN